MKNVNLYRICTEDVNPEQTRDLIGHHFDGFTLLHGEGFWKGGSEKALVIEIVGSDDPEEKDKIGSLIADLKEVNVQEAVLLEVLESVNYLI